MADELKSLEDYPDISFIDNYTLEALQTDMFGWFQDKMKELTGREVVLAKGDTSRLILMTCAYYIFQAYMLVDDAGKMNLLKYARGAYLDELGALKRVSRRPASGAHTTLRFTLQQERSSATPVAKGIRVTAGNNIYFSTDQYIEIPAGSLSVDVGATCTTLGAAGNDFDIGEINTLTDPVPFIFGVSNITKPENGVETESDESLRQRIYLAPASYSTAGTEDAYRYYALSFNPDITDVLVTNPEPRIVQITYLLKNGTIPGEESLHGMQAYLSGNSIRMLTDEIRVVAPKTVKYSINLTFYVGKEDTPLASDIQQKVRAAIEEYKSWQAEKIGRDINPDELVKRMRDAGAKRAEITAPIYTVIDDTSVAAIETESVTYGGLEDD